MTLNTAQPVLGSDRDLDYSDTDFVIDDMRTISYFLLNAFITLYMPIPSNIIAPTKQAFQNSIDGFEACNSLRDTTGATTGSAEVPDCTALFAFCKFYLALFRHSHDKLI